VISRSASPAQAGVQKLGALRAFLDRSLDPRLCGECVNGVHASSSLACRANGCHPGRSEAESREPLRCLSHWMSRSRTLLLSGLRVSGMTAGEHALILRRAHALRAAQDEGYRAVGLDSRSCFLVLGVGLRFGQIYRHRLCQSQDDGGRSSEALRRRSARASQACAAQLSARAEEAAGLPAQCVRVCAVSWGR